MADPIGIGELGRDQRHPSGSQQPLRRADWYARLWATLDEARTRPFRFGRHDCVRLVASCLDAMTDSDWLSCLADFYRSERGVIHVLKRRGLLDQLVSDALGQPSMPINLACCGDVVGLNLESGPAIGICVGDRVAVASDGVLYLPLDRAHCAWRIA